MKIIKNDIVYTNIEVLNDIVDILYMRLGYSVLLEWGNSSYYDNDNRYIPDNTYSLADKFLTGAPDVQYNTILETINKLRLDSCGNYDAMFGKVVNFSWNFTKEGTYDITLKIISAGDVIESLKANTLLGGTQTQTTEIQEQREQKEFENQPGFIFT